MLDDGLFPLSLPGQAVGLVLLLTFHNFNFKTEADKCWMMDCFLSVFQARLSDLFFLYLTVLACWPSTSTTLLERISRAWCSSSPCTLLQSVSTMARVRLSTRPTDLLPR